MALRLLEVFRILFYFFIFSYPGNAPPWQNPCIDDTILADFILFHIQFYEMDNKEANTFSFDYHKIWPSNSCNSWIGNREVMDHVKKTWRPRNNKVKTKYRYCFCFVFLHLQQQHIQSWAFIGWLWCIFLLPSKLL